MGRLSEGYEQIAYTDYKQGWADGTQAAEQAAMVLVAILVKRLGGKVEISDLEADTVDWRALKWHRSPTTQHTVYEVEF